MEKEKHGIQDLIKMAKIKNANLTMLLSDAYNRGFREGAKAFQKVAIEKLMDKDN